VNSDRVSEPTPFYRATTPSSMDIESYITEEFARLRGKRPWRVQIIHAPEEVDAIIYLDEVTEEDDLLVEKLERRLVEAGERVVFVAVPRSRFAAA